MNDRQTLVEQHQESVRLRLELLNLDREARINRMIDRDEDMSGITDDR